MYDKKIVIVSSTFKKELYCFSIMLLDINSILILVGIGLFAGIVNTLAGGGSLVTLPVLILFLGLDEATANGTNRLMVIVAAIVASYGYKSKGISTHPYGLYFGIAATFGAIIGAKIAIDIDGDTFKRFLAIIMITVGLIIVFRSKSIASLNLPERLSGKYLVAALIGFFFIGIYGGFLQAGVGIIIMLLLTQVSRLSLVRTNSVKAFSVFFYSIAAVLIFALDGKIIWMVGLWMVLGSIVGAWLSSRWSVDKGDKVIRITLLIMVTYMAIKLWLDTFNT
ncbi:MAG TPA: sulfite exporter TauE/SafE family protein [Flavobacteriaceae bacterium]|nr:sulfite exporter TauE/SafE family protein [Flavobacteriaceae bacterium]